MTQSTNLSAEECAEIEKVIAELKAEIQRLSDKVEMLGPERKTKFVPENAKIKVKDWPKMSWRSD